jgi:hypothetical protein
MTWIQWLLLHFGIGYCLIRLFSDRVFTQFWNLEKILENQNLFFKTSKKSLISVFWAKSPEILGWKGWGTGNPVLYWSIQPSSGLLT